MIAALALASVLGAPELAAQLGKHTVAKLALGDGVVVINARSDGRVEVGAGSGNRVVTLVLESHAIRAWADSTAKILARRSTGRRGRAVVYRSSVEESETRGGGLSFTRRVRSEQSVYRLFFADRRYGGFPVGVTRTEALALLDAVHEAAAVTRKLSAKRRSAAERERRLELAMSK